MKLRLASDLHFEFVRPYMSKIEFEEHVEAVIPTLENDLETILMLPGDIDNAKQLKASISLLAPRFKMVLIVFGNHEYYKSNMLSAYQKAEFVLSEFCNVKILNSDSVIIDGVNFIGATMWADMDNRNPITIAIAKNAMNDFKMIRNGPESEPWKYKLDPHDTMNLFDDHSDFIFNNIKKDMKNVVMTHHAPSFKSIGEEHKGSPLNGAYATELHDTIYDCGPDLWVHGHMHVSSNYCINKTRVICNPYGYQHIEVNNSFNSEVIEL